MMKFYRHKDGFLTEEASFDEDGSIILPEGFVDKDILHSDVKAYIVNEDGTSVSLSLKQLAIRCLDGSDWKVQRHQDELALGKDTTLIEEEYLALLTRRQEWRETASD